jgi:hypothetical protein
MAYLLNFKTSTVFAISKSDLTAYDNCEFLNSKHSIAYIYEFKNNIFNTIIDSEISIYLQNIDLERKKGDWAVIGIISFSWYDKFINHIETFLSITPQSTH